MVKVKGFHVMKRFKVIQGFHVMKRFWVPCYEKVQGDPRVPCEGSR